VRKDCPEADQHSQPYKTLRDPHHVKYAVVIANQKSIIACRHFLGARIFLFSL